VAGIDVNMGCPHKFSVQGGCGAALLKEPEKAAGIVRVLAQNLSVPVTAKIRLLPTPEETVAFALGIQAAGARALTVHLRHPHERDRDPAHWDQLRSIVDALSIPVIANGDFYDLDSMRNILASSRCHGIMLARPALWNASLFRCAPLVHALPPGDESTLHIDPGPALESVAEVIRNYLVQCLRWDENYKNAKYTVMEMMTSRRHPLRISREKPKFEQGLDMGAVSRTKSLIDLASLWRIPSNVISAESRAEAIDAPDGETRACLSATLPATFRSLTERQPLLPLGSKATGSLLGESHGVEQDDSEGRAVEPDAKRRRKLGEK